MEWRIGLADAEGYGELTTGGVRMDSEGGVGGGNQLWTIGGVKGRSEVGSTFEVG